MTRPDLINTPITGDIVFGASELETTPTGVVIHRLPPAARQRNTDPQLAMAEAQPSGVRLRFATAASLIELHTLPTKRDYVGMPARPDGIYDLLVDGHLAQQCKAEGGRVLSIDMTSGTTTLSDGSAQTLRFADLGRHDKQVEIWLPHNETTELVALHSDAPISPIASQGPVWLHHGSSISQGSNATAPTGIWPVVAAQRAGVDLVNMGFGGSALLDPFTARAMRDTAADLISVKIGINIVNADLMRLRAFRPAVDGFLDTIREGHPTAPLLIVSPIFCPIHEDTPGPAQFDFAALKTGQLLFRAEGDSADVARGKLTLNVIRSQLHDIVAARAATDANLHYLDGRALYGEADHARFPLPDRLHPDTSAHQLMGERFDELAFRSGAFSAIGRNA